MRKLFLLFLLLLCLRGVSQPTTYGKIVLRIEGIESSEGNVMVAVYNSPETFNSYDRVFASKIQKAKAGTIILVFDSIPEGYYALSCIHDKNSSMDIDKNRLGVPTEMFGFSQNKMGRFGPPDFDQAKIRVEAGKTISHTLRLRSLL